LAARELQGSDVKVCTVIGFPLGANTSAVKAFETKNAIENGAEDIDMVINIGRLKAGDDDFVEADIHAVVKASGHKLVKVIIETCLLSDDEKVKMCEIVSQSNADFIKTSTGFSTSGATFDDIKLMKEHINGKKIKAAGGIKSFSDGEKFISLGADRLGTSRLVKIMKEG
jgi:deoxyribose-phosphate aldolase